MIVPLKSFATAKSRLSETLDDDARISLARSMATTVVGAAGELDVLIATDAEDVIEFARTMGIDVVSTHGCDLDASVERGVRRSADIGATHALVAHGDLPFARDLTSLTELLTTDVVLIVSDRHGDGTNVIGIPTSAGFRFAYGPGSAARHRAEAQRLGLPVIEIDDEHLAWDVDTPEDLAPPPARSVGR